jgi:hypothetical protein
MLNGIRYSIEMYDIAYRSLLHVLSTIDSEQDNQKDDSSRARFPSVLLHAWSMVDTANRLRELLKHAPGLPRRDPHFRANLRMLEKVEELRNPIQHLHQEITTRAEDAEVEPVWGSLSWGKIISTNPPRALIFFMLPGSIEPTNNRPVKNVAGGSLQQPVDLIELSAYGTTISLSEMYTAITKLTGIIENGLKTAFEADDRLADRFGADLILTMTIEFQE